MSGNGDDAARRLGAAIRAHRLARGLSLRALARAVGLTGHGTLVDYEHGRRLPPLDLLTSVERALGVPDGELLRLRDAALADRGQVEAARLLQDPPPAAAREEAHGTAGDAGPSRRRRGPTRGVVIAAAAVAVAAVAVAAVAVTTMVMTAVVAASRPSPESTRPTQPTQPPAPAPAAAATSVVMMDFERPGERWSVFWGSQVARSEVTSAVAHHGRRAVLVKVTGATSARGYSAVGTTHGLTGLRPGMKVTTWLWVPGAQPGAGVRFFAMDAASRTVFAPENPDTETRLPAARGWTSFTWTVPRMDELHAIGVQLYAETDDPVTVGIDEVTW
ncbi:helix-turn-helix domain-containing protein [Actinomadura sp. ATCC 31491]|uniref:Helix-turn-helix domain-containing protein n=1 Tax=Actinomadura luzonensis TaxID=2805427 RepID=A0ABT0G9P4_9ACTN|nr:helix-turn-helix transcriptional regulator [Actinomadura luzonensis]MCK2221332.1 helix-turn-helix domain-containing protein [Actinomadura luzonensis]